MFNFTKKFTGQILVFAPLWLYVLPNSAISEVFSPKSFVLNNGLTVVVVEDYRAPVVTHMVWYKVGSADEPTGASGIAHFLEHLMFKGTKRFKPGEASKIIAKNGGNENAFTSYDYTAFYQTVSPDKLSVVMDIESDRMQNLQLSDNDILAERDVVLEERRTRTDNSDAALFREQVNAAMYLTYPYRVPIIGWANEIKRLNKEMALTFYDRWYAPNNAILVVAGAVAGEDVKELAEIYYGVIPKKQLEQRRRVQEPPQIAARRLTMDSEQVGQASWSRRYRAPSYKYGKTHHTYALQVLNKIIGGGTTSRLYHSLVVENNLAVSAGSWYRAENIGPSVFGFYASPQDGISIEKLENGVDSVINSVVNGGVSQEEVDDAKTQLQRSAVFAKDSVTAPARTIGSALAMGRSIQDIESWPDKVSEVTRDDVIAAAKWVLQIRHSLTAVLLPKINIPKKPGKA
ncbi:insulinase family protein [Rhodospirillaceae bacterium]|nr:insulinase family protein [Rhodospirillaceae bacterium]|tara:strand:+ start:68 stop:1444 length:1377 start_codon:yes stop_codon:yes gene_type:complete